MVLLLPLLLAVAYLLACNKPFSFKLLPFFACCFNDLIFCPFCTSSFHSFFHALFFFCCISFHFISFHLILIICFIADHFMIMIMLFSILFVSFTFVYLASIWTVALCTDVCTTLKICNRKCLNYSLQPYRHINRSCICISIPATDQIKPFYACHFYSYKIQFHFYLDKLLYTHCSFN